MYNGILWRHVSTMHDNYILHNPIGYQPSHHSLSRVLGDIPFWLNSRVYLVQLNNNKRVIYEIYNNMQQPHSQLIITQICHENGNVSPFLQGSHSSICNPESGIWERRKNLTGMHLTIAALTWKPLITVSGHSYNASITGGVYQDLFLGSFVF